MILKNYLEKTYLLQVRSERKEWFTCDISENKPRGKKNKVFEGARSKITLQKALEGAMKKYSNFDPKNYRIISRITITYEEVDQ